MTEGSGWRTALGGGRRRSCRSLGSMPLFRPADDGSGELIEFWDRLQEPSALSRTSCSSACLRTLPSARTR